MATWFELPDLPIRVTAQGAWLHGDEPMHPRVARLFARHVVPSRHGPYRLQIGMAQATLETDDTPFLVRSMALAHGPDGALTGVRLSLSDGADEPLDPATLMQGPDNVLYCRVQRHGLSVPCRFQPGQYHALAWYAELEHDQASLRLGGRAWPIGAYDPAPRDP